MADSQDTLISAQVLLRSASGKAIDPKVPITAANLAEFAPSPATVAAAAKIFRTKGFEVGPMVGISFSVAGTIRTFEEFFGVKVQMGGDGAYEFVVKDKVIGPELPRAELPKELRDLVTAVAFPRPFELFP